MSCGVLILAKNEEKHIADCIDSCSLFADEILVLDDYSSDATAAIAQAHGAKVIQRALNGDWGQQQTFGIQQLLSDWVFLIDSDERCHSDTAKEILEIVQGNEYKAYWVKRLNFFNGKRVRFGMLSPDWVMRLIPRKGASVKGCVHQQIISDAQESKLQGTLSHYTYDTWSQLEKKMNKYSTLAAEKYFEAGKKSRPIFDIALRPFFAFFKMYVLKLGFVDGLLGFALSLNYANYTLAKYFKLYELNRQK